MKKLLFLCLSFMLIFTFMACGDKPSENIGPTCVSCDNLVSHEGDVCSSCKTSQKLALYNKVIGTWDARDFLDEDYVLNGCVNKIVFTSDSILLDDNIFAFNPSTDIYFEEEVPEEWRWSGETFYFYINNKYYSIIYGYEHKWAVEDDEIAIDNNLITVSFPYYDTTWQENNANSVHYLRNSNSNSGSGSGTGALDFSLVGEWSYQINGSINTSLTINSDNTFDFVGGGSTSYSGTYSLSGNKITFEFDQNASMNIKDTFVVSGSDTEMTLTLEKSVSTYNGQENVSTSMSSLLQIFYNIITSTSVTLSK